MMRAGLFVLIGLVLVAFVAGNWGAFTTSTVLTLGLIDVTAPLGLVMLVALVLVTVAFLAVMALWQGRILAESRRHAREIAQHRSVAENAEASRLTALQAQISDERMRLEARIEAAETTLRGELHEGINSLAAMVGEMDDRLAAEAPLDEAPLDEAPLDEAPVEAAQLPPRGSRH
jgi:hypothetical protein